MANRSGGPAHGDKTHYGERSTEHNAAAGQDAAQETGRTGQPAAPPADKTHFGERGKKK
jgi:hypothetical protein